MYGFLFPGDHRTRKAVASFLSDYLAAQTCIKFIISGQVWGGTSRDDNIRLAASINPYDYDDARDYHWFGMNPSESAFGDNTLPTEPTTPHDGYWDNPVSRDAMAGIMVGKGGSR